MHRSGELEVLFRSHGGVMRYKELVRAGISSRVLQRYVASGDILRARPGYYEWVAEEGPDEYALLRSIFPEGIICMHSALYIHGYTDRVPNVWHLAVPLNATRSKFNQPYPPVRAYFRTQHSLRLGVTHTTFGIHRMAHYDKERTICDCIAQRKRMEREVYVKALRAFRDDSAHDIALLLFYARQLRIEQLTRQIIELWQ